MADTYKYSLLKTLLNLKVGQNKVWRKRIQSQTQFIHLLEEAFGTEIVDKMFGFYPNRVYFATPLTSDPKYTKKAKPLWLKIIRTVEKHKWEVYAPFSKTDPHAKIPDLLDSFEIRDLDHIKVLTAEVALFDLNRPSHGVGQEIEMSTFMPAIGFSCERVSRLTKGMPGLLLINYKTEKELVSIIGNIFERKSFKTEPFYCAKCPNQSTPTVFKGENCLSCEFKETLHKP